MDLVLQYWLETVKVASKVYQASALSSSVTFRFGLVLAA